MSAKLPNDTAHVCRGGECVTFHIHDSRCQKLTDSVMGKFTFTDSAGVAHKLDFKGGSATLGDVHSALPENRRSLPGPAGSSRGRTEKSTFLKKKRLASHGGNSGMPPLPPKIVFTTTSHTRT